MPSRSNSSGKQRTTPAARAAARALVPVGALAAAAACGGPAPSPPLGQGWQEPLTGMELVRIEPAEFDMGLAQPPADPRPAPPHRVRITRPFYIGRFEVTQREWVEVMGDNPSQFDDCGPSCPVESVSWHDVQEFLERLSARSGERFRLPTEAEWELACRAGSDGRYTDGADVLSPDRANYDPEIEFEGHVGTGFRGGPLPVGTFAANAFGLHDIHGNVWEWTQDEYCPYPTGEVVDPWASCGSDTIPIRGGSWLFSANAARCGRRYTHARGDSGYGLGFRVVREVGDTPGVRVAREVDDSSALRTARESDDTSAFRVVPHYWIPAASGSAELGAARRRIGAAIAEALGDGVLAGGFPKGCTVVEPADRTRPFRAECVPGGPDPDGLLLDAEGRFLQLVTLDYLSARSFMYQVFLLPVEVATEPPPVEELLAYPQVAITHVALPAATFRAWLSAIERGIRAAGGRPFPPG